MFLTPEEIAELTGKQRRGAQRAVLNALGIQHKERPDGSLLVAREHVLQQFGAAAEGVKLKKEKEPNWGALAHAQTA